MNSANMKTIAFEDAQVDLVDQLLKIWGSDKYRGVMLPGAGSYTAFEVANAIRTALAKAAVQS